MARIVKEHDLGLISPDFTPVALAHCLLALDREKVNYHKLQSHKIARTLSSEQNKKILTDLVRQVLEA
jgi:hypothetical protein